MRREGSPFQGVGAVAVKELADNLSSARMFVLELLIVLTALAALYGAIDSLRQNTAEDPFLLLRLFTVDRAPLPSFVAILGFLIPLSTTSLMELSRVAYCAFELIATANHPIVSETIKVRTRKRRVRRVAILTGEWPDPPT